MTTEYFRVRNGLAVGEDKLTVDAVTGNTQVEGNLVVTGDLTINGTTTTLNTDTLNVEDNEIVLNSGVTGSATLDAAIVVNRGTDTDSSLTWNETADKWYQNRAGTSTVIPVNTTELTEGDNLYYTNTRARASISVTDTGGDGSLSYDNGTGVITYTGPSASEVRAHFSGGTGVAITDGVVSIGQSVGTGDSPSFAGVTGGNLTVGVSTDNTIASTNTNGNITLTPNGTGKVISGVTQLADNSMVMGSLLATTNSSYTFPAIPITRVSGNNGLDVASSTIIGNGNLGNAAQQQLTHYSGDILAGQGSFSSIVLRTANGNSVTGSTLPFTGAAQTAASGLLSGDVMGGFSFNGYATTDFTDFLGTRNQGGGFIGANSLQIQGFAAENFVDSTLTISGATITAVTRSSPGLSSVTVTGTRGQISFTATTPSVGQAVNVTGTNTGTSTGISAGTYYIVATAGTTGATLSATPGGVPITTTAGTTTGLTFSRRWITVTYSAQTYIPFGLQALVAVSGFTGATNGTYMTWGSGTTTTVNIGVDTTSVALSGTQSISTPTVTNAGSALRIRSIPVATPLNAGNRIDIVDHRPSAAIYRADSFTFNAGTYGNTGTSLLTIDSSGNVVATGDLAVNGANITTTATTANILNTIATTVNAFGAATTAVNIGTANGSILKGSNRSPFTSPVITAFTGTVAPSRGLLLNNGNGASAALARNTLLLRTYPTTGSSRGQLIFENARGTENVPTAVVSGDLMGEINATGYATNGFISDYVASIPALSFFTATETWANTGGPYPTAGTVTNAGTGYIISLQPTATNLTASSRISVLNINPQTAALRSDQFNVSDKTNNRAYISTSGAFDNNQPLAVTANLLNTNTNAGATVGITTNYRATSGGALTLPQSGNKLGNFRFNSYSDTAGTGVLAAQVITETTENYSSTANGSRIIFLANKQGENWTTGHVQVASFQPESSSFSSDIFTIENSAGTDYLVIDANRALFSKPVRNTITSASVAKGATYTPAATTMNSIILEITAGSGTTTIDVSNLTVAGENAVFDIMVYNNSGSSIAANALVIINNGNTALDHAATITNGDRAMFEVNCVDIYANAKYAGDAV